MPAHRESPEEVALAAVTTQPYDSCTMTAARGDVAGASTRPAGLTMGGTREMLLPLTVTTCFILYQLAQLPLAVVAAIASPMLVLYAVAPWWARRSLGDFDRDLVHILASGQRTRLRTRYQEALGMRMFAPPAVRAERHALVAAEIGDPRTARTSYGRALSEYGPAAPLRVMLGYAHACYSLGDDTEAIRVYRQLLEGASDLPGVRRNLAHALVRRGHDLDQALALLSGMTEDAGDLQRRGEIELVKALAYAKRGDRDRARELDRTVGEVHSEMAEAVRKDLAEALEPTSRPLV